MMCGRTLQSCVGYSFTTNHAHLDFDVIHRHLSETYWSPKIRREIVERAFRNSIVAMALDENANLVAFARVVSDRATFAWVCDVFVLPEHRGRGIARQLFATLEAHPDLQTLRRWCLATKDAQRLYQQLGYEFVIPGRWMMKPMSTERWQE